MEWISNILPSVLLNLIGTVLKGIQMKSGLSLIAMIIDASSSMAQRQSEVILSVNEALKGHREAEGDALVSIYQFAGETIKTVDFKNIKDTADFTYYCGGMTALYDAIGYAINDIGTKLSSMDECDRPEQVQIMIITDGEENSSRHYTSNTVSEMVKHQTTKYSWIFTYLGSNQDAIFAGSKLGIAASLCANYTDQNLSKTVGVVNSKMLGARKFSNNVTMALNSMSYSDLERESLVK